MNACSIKDRFVEIIHNVKEIDVYHCVIVNDMILNQNINIHKLILYIHL